MYSIVHPAIWVARADRFETDEDGWFTDVPLDMDSVYTDEWIQDVIASNMHRLVTNMRTLARTIPPRYSWATDDAVVSFASPPKLPGAVP